MVNFWGSWCSPCRAEAAGLQKTYVETRADGVTFVGVNSRDDRDAAKAFERGRVTYPSIYDPSGKMALALTYVGLPDTYVVDRTGTIRYIVNGPTNASQLAGLIDDVKVHKGSGWRFGAQSFEGGRHRQPFR